MRKILALILLITISYTQSYSQISLEIGYYSMSKLKTKNFNDFHISDWELYGLGQNTGESRMLVPLSSKHFYKECQSIYFAFGFDISKRFSIVFDLPIIIDQEIIGVDVNIGGIFNFINNESFTLGTIAKLGYANRSFKLENLKIVEGYSKPLEIGDETYLDGFTLDAAFMGMSYNVGLTSRIYFIKNFFYLHGEIGYGGGIFGDIKFENIDLEIDDTRIVEPNETNNPAKLSPEIEQRGMYFSFGLGITMGSNCF